MMSEVNNTNIFWGSSAEKVLVASLGKMFSRHPRAALLDFFPGTNGNFLEYIINTFIFDIESVDDPFTDLYTVKCANFSEEYHRTRKCLATHWTALEVNYSLDIQNRLIRIIVDPDDLVSKLIHRINHVYRVGDVPFMSVSNDVKQDDFLLRTQLQHEFSKLRDLVPWRPHNGPTLEINFMDFYERDKFLEMLHSIAVFLGRSPRKISAALPYYETYIKHNHGWIFYNRAVDFINRSIFANHPPEELNLVEQAVVLALCRHEFKRAHPDRYNPFSAVENMPGFDAHIIRTTLFS